MTDHSIDWIVLIVAQLAKPLIQEPVAFFCSLRFTFSQTQGICAFKNNIAQEMALEEGMNNYYTEVPLHLSFKKVI